LRVLVVDDDPVALELFRAAVESWNLPIDCTYMASAMEALMDMASMRPDVLVSDLMMPGIDGFELLRTIRANPVFAGLLMLVVTSLSAEEIAARGGLPKHTQVAQKPLSMDWLQGFLAALVRSKELQADR
jgi:CheY-like chemotaxis protein